MSLSTRPLRTFTHVFLGVFLVGALTARTALAGVDRWTAFGPGGGTVTELVADPAAPETLYAMVQDSISHDSLFKSIDGGVSWRWSGDGLPRPWVRGPQGLAIDPSRPWILYAAQCFSGTAHIFRSMDGARRWSEVTPAGGVGIPIPVPGPSTCRLAVSPGRAVYLAVDAELWRSLDQGAAWSLIGGVANTIRSLLVDPYSPSTLYVGAARAGGVYRYSLKEGALTRIPGLRQGEALAASRTGRRLYVSSAGILYDSVDHGATWRRRGSLGTTAQALAVDAGAVDLIYAAHARGASVSRDGGKTWKSARGLPVVSFPGPPAHVAVLALAAHPFQPGRIFAGTQYTGVYETRDGGDHWQAGDQLGLGGANYRPPDVHPARPETIYVRALDNVGTLWRSTNGGLSWSRRSSAFGRGFFLSEMALDPRSPKTLYGSGSLAAGGHGVFRSLDGGATWTAFGPPGAVAVGVTGSGVLLFSVSGGFWRSTDGGVTGSVVNARVGRLIPDPANPETVYLLAGEQGEDGVHRTFLERSRDGGLTWTTLLENKFFIFVAFAPGRVYALIGDKLLRSTDGGETWSERGRPAVAGPLVVSPLQPDTLLCSGMGTGVFLSRDGGLTWTPFDRGLAHRGPFYFTQLGTHPADPHTFFAAPFGAGLFIFRFSEISERGPLTPEGGM